MGGCEKRTKFRGGMTVAEQEDVELDSLLVDYIAARFEGPQWQAVIGAHASRGPGRAGRDVGIGRSNRCVRRGSIGIGYCLSQEVQRVASQPAGAAS